MSDELDPKDFEDTARAAVEACATSGDCAGRARVLADAGLLGVIAPEEAGGLGLPLKYAVPVAGAAGAGLLAFPLIESLLLARALAGIDAGEAGRIYPSWLSDGAVIASWVSSTRTRASYRRRAR